MSSSLNHYTADVQVTDAVMHNKTPLAVSKFSIAVLAANVMDAQSLIQEFYGRSGMASKIISGVHTLYRAATPNVPGAIRTVSVTNVTLVPAAATVSAAVTTTTTVAKTEADASPATTVSDTTSATTTAASTSKTGRGRKSIKIEPSSSTETVETDSTATTSSVEASATGATSATTASASTAATAS